MFLPLKILSLSTLWKEKDNVLTLLSHRFVFGRTVSLPLQQRAANHPNLALAISHTRISIPAVGNGLYRQVLTGPVQSSTFTQYRHRHIHATEPEATTALQLATALLYSHEQQDLDLPRKGEEENKDSSLCGHTLL